MTINTTITLVCFWVCCHCDLHTM